MSTPPMSLLRTLLLASAPFLLGACTMVGAPVPGTVSPSAALPAAPPPASARPVDRAAAAEPAKLHEPVSAGARVADIALESIGTPYVWGGDGEDGFDCSGLIRFAYAQIGIRLPRVSSAQIRAGAPVSPDPERLRPGDVLGFSDDGGSSTDHVGLYIGDGAFIHSSSSGVRVSALSNPYWRDRLVAARRIID